jgi:hypothetical protein
MISKPLFYDAITILQRYTFSDLLTSRDTLKEQRKELKTEQQRYRTELDSVYTNVHLANDKYEEKIQTIMSVDIPKLQKVIMEQQRSSIYTQSKKITIARITECNQKISMLEKSIQENKLKLTRSAKNLMSVIREIDKIDNEILGLDECEKIYNFIAENRINLETLTQEQMEKIYGQYTRQAVK